MRYLSTTVYRRFIIRGNWRCSKFIYNNVCFTTASTSTLKHESSRFNVHIIPALQDNYMYVLIDKINKIAAAVDPVEPRKILNCVEKEEVELKAILTTHHHLDHAGGNKLICELVKNIPVYGGDDRIDCLTKRLAHDESVMLGDFKVKCLYTPCHTRGHVCYFINESYNEPICFTGDTLFVSGCGRFFEGSACQMYKSLSILSALPPNTKIYCGHEYSLSNLKFALSIEPENNLAINKLQIVNEKLKKGEPSVPSTIEEELSYNPFMRVNCESILQFTKQTNPVSAMAVLREMKNNFKD